MQKNLSVLILLGIFAPGCFGTSVQWPGDSDLECTSIGCTDRLEILVEREDGGAFDPGEYRFVFTPSEDSIDLNCTLLSSSSWDCSGGAGISEYGIENSAHGFVFVFEFAPPTMRVEVYFEGELMGMETLSPDYTIFTPNGPECEPTCFQSSEVIKLSENQ